jgi:hypothetical protein
MFNFKNSTALASQQDDYLAMYFAGKKLSSKEISDMEQNLWVATAAKLAPGNLILRQWALIDLFKGSADHKEVIQEMMDTLTYKEKGTYKIWAEGYSYFRYTMAIINPWVEKFNSQYDLSEIIEIIEKTNEGFIVTSYSRNGVLYSAPFGDLRDEPLSPDLQIPHDMKTIAISNVIFNYTSSDYTGSNGRVWYSIGKRPIGLNTHINNNDFVTGIHGGFPVKFKYYTGYNNKYKNSWEEFKDTFNPDRILTVTF